MTKKNEEKIVRALSNAVETSLKPAIKDISEKLGDSSYQMNEIKSQLDRIEYKIDILLSAQALNKNLVTHKRKIIRS